MAIRIVPFEDAHWPGLARFLHEHWQANHPLCQRELFYWQYRGFGPMAGASACRLLADGERILGFLGAIPGLYVCSGATVPGMALALWVVVEDLRNSGLGILLMHEVEKQAPVTVCLGINPKVLRYYTASGYKHLEALHRYVCPLDVEGYGLLLNEAVEAGAVETWARQIRESAADPVEPEPIDPVQLAALWRQREGRWQLALSRTEEFWAWRYREAVGFQYQQFVVEGQGGVIARLDRIREADKPTLEGRAVLRIIEVLPAGDQAASSQEAAPLRVLAGVLRWASQQGAIAADFQCASTRFEAALAAAGMRRRSPQDAATHLPELFCPLRRAASPINLVAKVKGQAAIDFDGVYCVKSDGDMDRPARWPV